MPLPPEEILPPVPADPPPRVDRPEKRVIAVAPADPPRAAAPPPALPPPPPAPAPTTAVPARKGNRKPDYPRRAIEENIEGRVLLSVEVLSDGSVGTIEVKVSSGHAMLDQAAIRAVRDWVFTPATVQGRPVRSLVEVPIRFTLTN
jgi:protein TonB